MPKVPHPAKAVIIGRGEKLRQAAEAVGVNEHSFGRVLNGHVDPWPAFRERLSSHLGLPEAELFHQHADPMVETADLQRIADLVRAAEAS